MNTTQKYTDAMRILSESLETINEIRSQLAAAKAMKYEDYDEAKVKALDNQLLSATAWRKLHVDRIKSGFLKEWLMCSTVSKRGGEFTARKGFFYSKGKTADDFRDRVVDDLQQLGLRVTVTESREVWKPFRGGASVANQTHWLVKFTIS